MSATLSLYTIYDHPLDYPDCFVVRRFEVTNGGSQAKEVVGTAATLDGVRDLLPERWNLVCLPRAEQDDRYIVETWI